MFSARAAPYHCGPTFVKNMFLFQRNVILVGFSAAIFAAGVAWEHPDCYIGQGE
jgi:hypothetical protein